MKFTSVVKILSLLGFVFLLSLSSQQDDESVASSPDFLVYEQFDKSWGQRWKHSKDSKYNGKFILDSHVGLKAPDPARHYGISTVLDEPVDPSQGAVLQYQVKYGQKMECGGSYLKFLTSKEGFKAENLVDSTPYTIMFGPDVCGPTNKVHLIFKHENPITKEITEKHLKKPVSVPSGAESLSVYTAALYPSNNSYAVYINKELAAEGSLYEDFQPGFNPLEEIDDASDKKPTDWVDDEEIADPEAKKPEDWDEDAPEFVLDPEATKPEDWDDEEDGEWEPPQVRNKFFKGKWSAPQIPNPEYKGLWFPRKIANPEYYNDENPLAHIGKIGGIAIEIWTMQGDINFDNIVISTNLEDAFSLLDEDWEKAVKKGKDLSELNDMKEQGHAPERPNNINVLKLKEVQERIEFFMRKLVKYLDKQVRYLKQTQPQAEPFIPYLEKILDFVADNELLTFFGFFGFLSLFFTSLIFLTPKASQALGHEEQIPVGQKIYKETIDANDKDNAQREQEISKNGNEAASKVEEVEQEDEKATKKKRTPRAD